MSSTGLGVPQKVNCDAFEYAPLKVVIFTFWNVDFISI